jgi:hypothetical protein
VAPHESLVEGGEAAHDVHELIFLGLQHTSHHITTDTDRETCTARETETERQRQRERQRDRERDRERE